MHGRSQDQSSNLRGVGSARVGGDSIYGGWTNLTPFPPEIIGHAAWLYHRFALSFRDVEDPLAQRGVEVSYETIRQWCTKFGPGYAAKLRRRRGRLGDTWHLDEVFVTIRGQRQYFWRAIDQDGDLIDILVQPRRNRRAAEKFFRKLLKGQGGEPRLFRQHSFDQWNEVVAA